MDNGMSTQERNGVQSNRERAEFRPIRSTSAPPVDVYENDEEVLVVADVPGARPDSVVVKVEKEELYITARREADADGRLLAGGRWESEYRRSFVVPRGTDTARISAELSHGVLQVHLPKSPAVKPRVIEIKTAS
jgi:HSP20 family protein